MQLQKFHVTHPNSAGSLAIISFNVENKLHSIEFTPDAAHQFIRRLLEELPTMIDDLKRLKGLGCKLQHIKEIDLSFEAFWSYYSYKVGNKKRTEKLWKELTVQDQHAVLGSVRKYKIFIRSKGQEQCYPETYLNQRRWENEFIR